MRNALFTGRYSLSRFFIWTGLLILFSCAELNAALPSRIIYVNQNVALTSLQNGTSWANAYRELSAALNSLASAPPSLAVEVWVARGTYKPTLGRDRSVAFKLVSHVHIVGGFEGNETTFGPRKVKNIAVLSGDIGDPQVNPIRPENFLIGRPPLVPDESGFMDNSFNVLYGTNLIDVVLDMVVVTGGNAT